MYMKIIFSAILFFIVSALFAAAPLASGYALAPSSSASHEEKVQAYVDARHAVINASMKYLNTPYLYGGMTAKGLDCSGFICLSFKDALGVSLPRSASALYSWTERIAFEEVQPGDLLFFKTDGSGRITHVGLYLGDRKFIHSASVGAQTGVMINSLDDGSWSKNYAGAGRVLPEAPVGNFTGNNTFGKNTSIAGIEKNDLDSGYNSSVSTPWSPRPESGRLLLGIAIAPTWNGFLEGGAPVRGFASQLRLGADTNSIGKRMLFGLELRPEYDGALGVFRLPITLSWGFNDQIRIFGGPVFSFGDAALTIGEEERVYSGGTTWFGTIGLTVAPFIFTTKGGEFAPYLEAAWQSYFSENLQNNFNADFSAGFRFSTGIRWTIQVNK